MTEPKIPRWLEWAREIQAIAQTGLTFSANGYDLQRYHRLMEIAAEIAEHYMSLPDEPWLHSFLAHPGYATPKVDVRAAIVRDGKILLVQERADERWCMPGGWADIGESPSAMVVREVREESGLEVAPRKLIGVYDANRSGTPLAFFHAYKLVFECDILGGEPIPSDETLDVRFFAFDSLPQLSSNRTDERHLADVLVHLDDPALPATFD